MYHDRCRTRGLESDASIVVAFAFAFGCETQNASLTILFVFPEARSGEQRVARHQVSTKV